MDGPVTFPAELRTFVDEQLWTFAKTMPEWPHEYIVREGRVYARVITYYEEAGMAYWTMGAPLHETTIITRCDATHTYEARLAAGTLPAQARDTEIPYVSHLLSVCALVLEDGGDEDEAIAALLHDTLEDHPKEVTASGLARRFGPRVRDLVVACTDTPPDYAGGPKAPWPERKAAYVEQIRAERYPLCRIALADKLHNSRAIVLDHRRCGDKVWKRFSATKEQELCYHRALVDAFREAEAPKYLLDELDSLVKELEAGNGAA